VPEPNQYWCDRYIECVKGSVEDDKPPATPLFRIDEIKLGKVAGYWQYLTLTVTYEGPKDITKLKIRSCNDLREINDPDPHPGMYVIPDDVTESEEIPNCAVFLIAVDAVEKTVFFRVEEY